MREIEERYVAFVNQMTGRNVRWISTKLWERNWYLQYFKHANNCTFYVNIEIYPVNYKTQTEWNFEFKEYSICFYINATGN